MGVSNWSIEEGRLSEEEKGEGEREKSVVLDKHHFSSKGHRQLLCVMVRGEEGGGRMRGAERLGETGMP